MDDIRQIKKEGYYQILAKIVEWAQKQGKMVEHLTQKDIEEAIRSR